ncbi:MAG: hypothetical protein IJN39_04710, partial [Clostridia bacterium]|nr:hypothetical protein [Clostridia bacterium]
MKKNKLSDTIITSLSDKIPERKIKRTEKPYTVYTEKDKAQPLAEAVSLEETVKKDIKNCLSVSDEAPRFRYVTHEKMDGGLTASVLAERLNKAGELPVVVLNPEINEADIGH